MAVKRVTKKRVEPKPRAKKITPSSPQSMVEGKESVPAKKSPEDNKNIYVTAIILLTISMLLLGAIISYFDNWQRDQSFNSFGQLFELSPYKVGNAMGKLGAITANILVGKLFGVFALCIPLIVVSFSFVLFRVNLLFYRKAMASLVPLTLIGATAAVYIYPAQGVFGSSIGGEWGYTMYIWLVNITGNSGAGFVIFAVFAIWLVFTSLTLFKYLGASFSKYVNVFIKGLGSVASILVSLFSFISKGNKQGVERIEREDKRVAAAEEELYITNTPFKPFEPQEEEFQPQYDYSIQQPQYNYSAESEESLPQRFADNDLEHKYEAESENESETESESGAEFESHQIDRDKYATIEHEKGPLLRPVSHIEDDLAIFEIKDIDPIDVDENVVTTHTESEIVERSLNDYSQTIDTNNIVLFTGVDELVQLVDKELKSSANEELPKSEVVEINGLEPQTEVVSAQAQIAVVSEQAQTDLTQNDTEIELDPTPIKRVAPTSNQEPDFEITVSPEVESADDFVIAGGYTASDDVKDDFEISVTSNAELQVDNIPDSENITITTNHSEEADDIDMSVYDPTKELSSYMLPPIDLLDNRISKVIVTEEELYENKNRIVETLSNFNISIDKIKATIGPTVTLYEIKPAAGVRISKIKNLEDDIALSLSALGIRIIAPIPGKGTIGIEVPNKNKEVVSMYSVVKSAKFNECKFDLPIVLGRTIQNDDFVIDLAKLPHLLVAGATGQGKSVGLNAIITSLLYKKHPAELKLVLIDPKKVELTLYSSIEKHFLAKMGSEDEAIITDTQKVIYTLNSLCIEMDARYDLLKLAKVRNIKEYNVKFTNRRLNPNKGHRFMPYFVVIIDEFADLIMTAGREIEVPIARIAQLARAVGIHLVIATQRPTTNIITGVIKANFPARIAFRVSSMVDSRTILDQPGANQLIGCGDMLVSTGNEVTRVQCAFIDTPEVERITDYISEQRGYPCAYELPDFVPESDGKKDNSVSGHNSKIDDKFIEVARYVVQNQQGSASTIQRNFSIGFNRAGRLMDQLEKAGIVSRQEGSKPRKVLVADMTSLEMILIDMEN